MTAIILQARLDSSRLPGKALLDLGGKPVVSRVMENLRTVPADAYVLACDTASYETFAPLAAQAGFLCMPGPKEDVLGRFCLAINAVKPDVVVRATGDNPFLFSDAAGASIRRFAELQNEACENPAQTDIARVPDYFTYTGLPHGSGVEVFSARALLAAARKSPSAYEREHVCPSLYLHRDEFSCVFEKAPDTWRFPDLRTTIDTPADYAAACSVADFLLSNKKPFPVLSDDILYAFAFVLRPVVFVPASAENTGTGHLRRTCDAVLKLRDSWNCFIYIPEYGKRRSVDEKVAKVLSSFSEEESSFLSERVITGIPHEKLPARVYRFVLDNFKTEEEEMRSFLEIAPVIAVDEGGRGRQFADYVFDVIPSLRTAPLKTYSEKTTCDTKCDGNLFLPSCVPLPSPPDSDPPVSKGVVSDDGCSSRRKSVETVLVAAGGSDEFGMALPYAEWFASCGFRTTVVCPSHEAAAEYSAEDSSDPEKQCANSTAGIPGLTVVTNIPALSEKLKDYDLVAAHFGFTAFEALASGCRVALFSPTAYHKKLARAYGFPMLPALPPSGFSSVCSSGRVRYAGMSVAKLRRFVQALADVPPVRGACAHYVRSRRIQSDIQNASSDSPSESSPCEVPGLKKDEYSGVIASLLAGSSFHCPFCGSADPPFRPHGSPARKKNKKKGGCRCFRGKRTVFRFKEKTIRFCPECGTAYIRYSLAPQKNYGREYFFDEYEKQYGKTYIDDFEAIRRMGIRRMKSIEEALSHSLPSGGGKSLLDVGCAFGPFLSAASDSGWKPFGTDISEDAVAYVRNTVGLPAVVSEFPDFNPASYGTQFPSAFTAVTFWYVIEHFKNLPVVFEKVYELLEPGGIFALSTPSCAGVSARKDPRAFFRASPLDHFSVWDPRLIKKQLARFGFRVVKIIVTGHHPERFPSRYVPNVFKKGYFTLCRLLSRVFKLGDTFEVYAEKRCGEGRSARRGQNE